MVERLDSKSGRWWFKPILARTYLAVILPARCLDTHLKGTP